MKKVVISLAVSLFGVSALVAETYTFPAEGKDIATDWGSGNTPGSSDIARFVTPATLTNSADVAFLKVEITPTSQNKSFIFDLRDPCKTVEVTNAGSNPSFGFGLRNTTAYLKGGVWKSSGSGYFTAGGKANCSVIFTNAATLTVAGSLVPGYLGNSGKIVFAGETKATLGSILLGYSKVADAQLEICGGSSVAVIGNVYTETQTTVSNGTLSVSGAGTTFTGVPSGNVHIGYRTFGNKLIVNDHAVFTCGQLNVGSQNDTATPSCNNAVYADGATLNLSNCRIGHAGSNNVAEFTNTTVTVSGEFVIGNGEAATENVVKLIGPQTTLSYGSHSDEPFFGSGSTNSVFFLDGAQHTLTVSEVSLAADTHDNVVHVEDAGQLVKTAGRMYVSRGSGYANALEIGANGTNQFYNLVFCSHDNRLVVSNGTLFSERVDPDSSLTLGEPAMNETKDNRLILQGSSPLISMPSSGIKLLNKSILRYELTDDGYATVPIVCTKLSMSDDSKLEVDPSALLTSEDEPTRTYCLADCTAENGGGIVIPETVLTAANAQIGDPRCLLYVENNRLLLKIRGRDGMILFIK